MGTIRSADHQEADIMPRGLAESEEDGWGHRVTKLANRGSMK